MSLKFSKNKIAQRECERLGHRITSTGITPLVRKTAPIEALETAAHAVTAQIVYGIDPQPA